MRAQARDLRVAMLSSRAMAVDVRSLLTESRALLQGHFKLSSGLHSPNYVQCALLLEQPRHATALGEAIAGPLHELSPSKIVAPALGGVNIGFAVAQSLDLPFVFTERKDGAMTLRRGFSIGAGEKIVIVEDVVTTGKSTRETTAVIEQQGGQVVGYASILNRSGRENPFNAPYHYLLALSLVTSDESTCALCEQSVPLDAPGSRFTAGSR